MTMVRWLILINIVAFIPQAFFRVAHNPVDILWFGLSWQMLMKACVWQVGTFVLIHPDIWPLFGIVITLWFLGRDLEYYIGGRALLKLYILATLAAAAAFLLLSLALPGSSPLIGSEAAFLAVLVAFATLWPDRPIMFDVSAKWWAVIFVAATTYYLAVYRGPAFLGHLGGAVVGYLFIKLAGYSEEPAWLQSLLRPWRNLGRLFRPKPSRRIPPTEVESEDAASDFISTEVDPILDKIAKQGIQSLTQRERKILESAREKIDKRR